MKLEIGDDSVSVGVFNWRYAVFGAMGLTMAPVSFLPHQSISLLFKIIWSSAFIAAGAYLLAFAEWGHFNFDVKTKMLKWKRFTIYSWQHGTIGLDHILFADLEYKYSRYGSDPNDAYRIVIKTREGDIRLTKRFIQVLSNGKKFCEARSAINVLLGVPAQHEDDGDIADLMRQNKRVEAKRLVKKRHGFGPFETDRYLRQLEENDKEIHN